MRRLLLSPRLFVIALVLARLVLGECVLPAAQAAAHESTAAGMTMTAGEPCLGMRGDPEQSPAAHGSCCKSAQCACLHAAALMTELQLPMHSATACAPVAAPDPAPITLPFAAVFRPPIQAR